MTKYLLIIQTIIFSIPAVSMFGQNGTVVCGNVSTDGVSEITFSVGQIDFESISDQDFTISQGLQQPFEISDIVSINEVILDIELAIFPNPTYNVINIINLSNTERFLLVEMFDLAGSKIISERWSERSITLQIDSYPAGMYVLKISDENQISKSYKISKK